MRFFDTARIDIKAGNGGPGSVSFRREKFIPKGGPDGGDGGRGGNIFLLAEPQMGSLLDYKYQQHFSASSGCGGSGARKTGSDGEDLTLPVPPGTLVYDDKTSDLLADLSEVGQKVLIARAGRGGKGNSFFKSSVRQTPRFAQPGEEGESLTLRLELKLLADVGLVGLPNAGKSSLLRAVTSARPKVADYPFTTLNPQLGVVKGADGRSFVMADIPGLIEGASEGAGLGLEFLKHIERCRVLLQLVDASPLAPLPPEEAIQTVETEMLSYSPLLHEKTRWLVITKADLVSEEEREECALSLKRLGYRVFVVSAATQYGMSSLLNALTEEVFRFTPVAPVDHYRDGNNTDAVVASH